MSPYAQNDTVWVAVGDGRQFQVYAREITPDAPEAQEPFTLRAIRGFHFMAEAPESYETGRKTSASVFESSGPGRHKSEPHMDVRTLVKQHMTKDVADALNAARRQRKFDRLILIAPPNVLGLLRPALDKEVAASVSREIAKNLVAADMRSLKSYISDVMPLPI